MYTGLEFCFPEELIQFCDVMCCNLAGKCPCLYMLISVFAIYWLFMITAQVIIISIGNQYLGHFLKTEIVFTFPCMYFHVLFLLFRAPLPHSLSPVSCFTLSPPECAVWWDSLCLAQGFPKSWASALECPAHLHLPKKSRSWVYLKWCPVAPPIKYWLEESLHISQWASRRSAPVEKSS